MTTNNAGPDNEVGYGKPPKHTRFRNGVSGNPRGRPKGRKNLVKVIEKSLQEKVVINENGVRKTVTKAEAAGKQLSNKAASGDIHAMRLVAGITDSSEDEDTIVPTKEQLDESDRKTIQGFIERLTKSIKGGGNE